MVEIYSWIIDGTAPVDALARVLEHLWSEELEHYEASPTPGHLFGHLTAIANWMNSGSDWTPAEYVAACRAFPDAGWQVSAMYERPGNEPGPGEAANDSRRHQSMMFSKDDLIFAYARQQAIADGVLVDVTETAKQAGFAYPVALTQGAWAECVAVPEGVECQDEAGRLWDVLCMLRFAVKRSDSEEIRYSLYVQKEPDGGPVLVSLKAVCGPDDGSPCITVMLPQED